MAKDTDTGRNPDGTFARKDDGSSGEDAPERDIENVRTSGGEDEKAEFIESFDKPGLGEEEAGSRIEQMLQAAAQEPDEIPDDVDPEAVEAARRALDEEGSIEAAQDAIEQNLQQAEAEEAREAAEGPEPVPFDQLAQDLGFEDPRDAAEAVTVRAKVDGEETDLSLSEALEGYQRQADYTRKTQELAEERQEVKAKGEQYLQQLEMLATTIGRNMSPEQQEMLAAEYQRVLAEVSDQATPDPETVQEEQEQLRQTFDWEGDSEWQEARSNIREYAHDLGFTDQDLASVTDHRLLTILEKSRRYDELAETIGRDPTEDAARPSKTLKPGVDGRTQESVERTRQRLKDQARTGTRKPALNMVPGDSVEDAAGRIEGILNSEDS